MSLYSQMIENNEFSSHELRSMIADYSYGFTHRDQIVEKLNLDTDSQSELDFILGKLDAFDATALSQAKKALYILELHDVAMNTQSGRYLTETHVKARIRKIGEVPSGWQDNQSYTVSTLARRGGYTFFCTAEHTSTSGNAPGTGADWETVWELL